MILNFFSRALSTACCDPRSDPAATPRRPRVQRPRVQRPRTPLMMRLVLLGAALVGGASAHAGLIIPTTRNSIDRLANGFSVDGTGLGTPCTCAVRASAHLLSMPLMMRQDMIPTKT